MNPVLILALALAVPLALAEAQAQGRAPQQAQATPPTMPDAPPSSPAIAPAAPLAAPAPAAPTGDSAPAPVMPLGPPAPPVIPPPIAVPTRPVPPPPQVEIVADAPGAADRLGDGLRVTFGAGIAVLNPATAAALREFARGLPPSVTVTVSAFAPGTPEDPSTSRRLSLARALAARGVLIGEGVASPRILVRALGASAPIAEGPPDRVDLLLSPTPQPRPAP